MFSLSTLLLLLTGASFAVANANFPANRVANFGRRATAPVNKRQNPSIAQVLADANILQQAVLIKIAQQLYAAENAIVAAGCNTSAGYTLNNNGAIFICTAPNTSTTSAAVSTTTVASSTTTTTATASGSASTTPSTTSSSASSSGSASMRR